MRKVAGMQSNEITAAQLAVNGEVEQGEVTDLVSHLQACAEYPDFYWLPLQLLTDEFPLISWGMGRRGDDLVSMDSFRF